MDQDTANLLNDLDNQINNLNLNPQISADNQSEIQTQRSAIDSKATQFKKAEQDRLKRFQEEIKQDISTLKSRVERLQS